MVELETPLHIAIWVFPTGDLLTKHEPSTSSVSWPWSSRISLGPSIPVQRKRLRDDAANPRRFRQSDGSAVSVGVFICDLISRPRSVCTIL